MPMKNPAHPGRIVRSACLEPLGLSITEGAKILGVTPTAPGYREVSIRPALGDLTWAKGEVPTPHGQIRVNLTSPTTGEITLPGGITGMLHLAGHPPLTVTGGKTHVLR